MESLDRGLVVLVFNECTTALCQVSGVEDTDLRYLGDSNSLICKSQAAQGVV